ncbi:unnamed protein product, partial [Prorocentrum cordatum]
VVEAAFRLKTLLMDVDLDVAVKKSRASANLPAARHGLAARLRRPLGVISVKGERNLGVDFSCGRRIARTVCQEKLVQAGLRQRRVAIPKTGAGCKKAARKVARAGIDPSVTYGVTVTGCATMELDTLRTESFKAVAPSVAGRSRTLTLMLTPMLDPMIRATLLPTMMLLRAAWESWIPQHTIDYGMACCQVQSRNQVRGPFQCGAAHPRAGRFAGGQRHHLAHARRCRHQCFRAGPMDRQASPVARSAGVAVARGQQGYWPRAPGQRRRLRALDQGDHHWRRQPQRRLRGTAASHGGQGPGPCAASCRVGAHDARREAEGLHHVLVLYEEQDDSDG